MSAIAIKPNILVENEKDVHFHFRIKHAGSSFSRVIRLTVNDFPKTQIINDAWIKEMNEFTSERIVISLGFTDISGITPEEYEAEVAFNKCVVSAGDPIGTYDGKPIPGYIEIDDRRYNYKCLVSAIGELIPGQQITTQGFVFELDPDFSVDYARKLASNSPGKQSV